MPLYFRTFQHLRNTIQCLCRLPIWLAPLNVSSVCDKTCTTSMPCKTSPRVYFRGRQLDGGALRMKTLRVAACLDSTVCSAVHSRFSHTSTHQHAHHSFYVRLTVWGGKAKGNQACLNLLPHDIRRTLYTVCLSSLCHCPTHRQCNAGVAAVLSGG